MGATREGMGIVSPRVARRCRFSRDTTVNGKYAPALGHTTGRLAVEWVVFRRSGVPGEVPSGIVFPGFGTLVSVAIVLGSLLIGGIAGTGPSTSSGNIVAGVR
jgi:hypothetical protein